MKRKQERSRRLGNGDRRIIDLMKQSGYLFPETDEQMAAFEANMTPRELPEKFRTPEFVFNCREVKEIEKHEP